MKMVLVNVVLLALWLGNVLALPNPEISKSGQVAEELTYKSRLLEVLVKQIPKLLETFDAQTGRFGKGIWICTDQNLMYPLAVAYAYKNRANPYYKDKLLLEVIVKAGNALIEDADERGQWVFRKKDGSTWGNIWMPWTYSRWVRSYILISSDMPSARRQAWARALRLGYTGISKTQLKRVHNIPAHHAMGLYVAGKAMNRPEWCEQASLFFMKVIAEQAEGGYWSENFGPVVGYNFVYLDALGTYYALSGNRSVLPAVEKGATFHYHFRYPDGTRVETVDERNPYKKGVDLGNVGFTFSPIGRAYLKEQWSRYGWEKLPADLIASLLLYGEEGPIAEPSSSESHQTFVLKEDGNDRAATIQSGPWFICLSAYATSIPQNRWIQDRQNFVSIYHDQTGIILGGGNTKMQPAWSNFTVGDMNLLRHQRGDENPDFIPKGELYHVPSEVKLVQEPEASLVLTYGPETCRIRIKPKNDKILEYVIESTAVSQLPVFAHLTLIPKMNESLGSVGGKKTRPGESEVDWPAQKVGGQVIYAGYRLHLPKSATLHWPALPHNPYRKDGRATPAEGRIEVCIPFDAQHKMHTIIIEVLK